MGEAGRYHGVNRGYIDIYNKRRGGPTIRSGVQIGGNGGSEGGRWIKVLTPTPTEYRKRQKYIH